MDTVEWGNAGPVRRRLATLRYTVPQVSALGLALVGFFALVVAELLPWGTVHLAPGSGAAAAARTTRLPFHDGEGLGLDRLQSFDVVPYHLGVLVLLGAIGFGLVGVAARRRGAMGAALGVAAGTGLAIIALYHAATHFFDGYGALYFDISPDTDPGAVPTVSAASGVYVALVAVALLAASALSSGLVRRRSVTPPPAEPDPGSAEERQFEVSALEPVDEAYFARPDGR